MSKREILITRLGEMRDMIACLAIYHGAKPKKTKIGDFLTSLGVS